MKLLDYFKQITQIPHCSRHAEDLKDFLISFAKAQGYRVETDQAGNILARKANAKICLQAHYDMVCVGRAPEITVVEKDGWLSAEDASLGADNGIAVAMMMVLMEEGAACEFLFTVDEEVGLIGANALAFDLQSRYMLNLDSEEEGEVYIGCAGGVDIEAERTYAMKSSDLPFYKVRISGLPGGHSGVDIGKNIPNAIKVFAAYAKAHQMEIAHMKGGERINSIPTQLEAVVASSKPLPEGEHLTIVPLSEKIPVAVDSAQIVSLLEEIPHGVLAYNDKLGIPDRSVNLAKIVFDEGKCRIDVSLRAMDEAGLAQVESQTASLFRSRGYRVQSHGKYPAWKPEVNDFSEKVCQTMRQVVGTCRYRAIHAGLECAVISHLYPDIAIASIGPTIRAPHSVSESVEIASVERTFQIVRQVIDAVSER